MKTIYFMLLLITIGISTAKAQLASDSPASTVPAQATGNTQVILKTPTLASETVPVDTLSKKNKQARVQIKNLKLPSETEAPRKQPKPKN